MKSECNISDHFLPLRAPRVKYLHAILLAWLSLSYLNPAHAKVLAGPIVNPANGNSYYLLDEASWTASQKEAVKLGGNLVTINDKAEDLWVYQQFSKFGGRSRNLWIGLNDVETEGEMVWASGEPVNYTHWVPREPNDALGGEDYVVMWKGRPGFAYGGYWNDLRDFGGTRHVFGVVEVAGEQHSHVNMDKGSNSFSHTHKTKQSVESNHFQNFEHSPLDWVRINNPLGSNDFGYSTTSYANNDSSRGEAGGKFVLTKSPQFYVDTTIGGKYRLSEPLRASGDFDVTALDSDFNANVLIGFMDKDDLAGLTPDFLGLVVLDNSTTNYRLAAGLGGNDFHPLSTRLTLDINVDRKFTINWNPQGGKNGGGLLVITVSGPGGGVLRLDLTAAQRESLGDVEYDSFGLSIARHKTVPYQGAAYVYVDNLVYSNALHSSDLSNFSGTYRVIDNGRLLKVKNHGDLYSIDAGNWVGTGFWDRTNWQYEGVYRYKDNPTGPLKKHQPGGEAFNAVGYHRIKPLGNGKLSVLWRMGLEKNQEQGTYVIERVSKPRNRPKDGLGYGFNGFNAIDAPRQNVATTSKSHFAYVFLHDEPAGASFQKLLLANGYSTDLIALDDVVGTNWSKYSAVIIGSDIERACSKSIANTIRNTKLPIIGLGEGGYYFLGKLGLEIGWPNGYHGAEVGVRPVQPEETSYWASEKLEKHDSGELALYSSSRHVAIYLPKRSPAAIPLAYELSNESYSPIMEQDRRYLLWGFTASPAKMTSRGKQLFVHTCRYLMDSAHQNRGTGKQQLAASRQPEFAFIYLKMNESTLSFEKLMNSNGLTAKLINLQDVPATDFTSYKAVIAGPDIERAWSKKAADSIGASKKPVLGLGEGGSALFEKFHLDIGWMHTYHGGEVGVRVVNKSNSPYWESVDFDLNEGDEQMLYSSTGHVAVHLSKLSSGVTPLTYELNNRTHSPIIEQDGRYLLWGFRESPLKMTPLGKKLFLHTCRYVANGIGQTGTMKESTATKKSI